MQLNSAWKPGYQYALAAALGLVPVTFAAMAADGAAVEEAKPKWESSAGLAFAASTGNTENLLFTANASTQLLGEKNEWRFGVAAGYGESRAANDPDASMEKNTEFIRAFGQYDRLLSNRWYALARAEALYDSIADIDYRVPISLGMGYYFIRDEKFKLSADAGPGYVWEKLGGVTDEYATLRIGQQFEWKISAGARLWERVDYTPEIGDFGNYVLNGEVGLEAKLTGALSMRLVAQNTYRSEPAPGRKENDFRFLAGLQYSF
jgi:putative salt-induced outer membrane protein YdiY